MPVDQPVPPREPRQADTAPARSELAGFCPRTRAPVGGKKDLCASVSQRMKLATRAAAADTTEHRGIERLTDDQERELGPRSQWIFNCEFPALGQPGKGGAQSIDRAARPGLVILARSSNR